MPPIGTAVDSLIRTDYRADGREAAKGVTDKSTAKSPTLILTTDDAPSMDFVAGAQEALAKTAAPVQTMMIANMLDLSAMVIPAVRDQGVRTIIASDDALALAAIETLKRVGISDGIEIIGHGGTKEATQAVLDGTLAGDVDTRPQSLGVAAIGNIAALARKKQPASDLIVRINGADVSVNAVPGRLITRDSARDMQERWPDLVYTLSSTPAPTPQR